MSLWWGFCQIRFRLLLSITLCCKDESRFLPRILYEEPAASKIDWSSFSSTSSLYTSLWSNSTLCAVAGSFLSKRNNKIKFKRSALTRLCQTGMFSWAIYIYIYSRILNDQDLQTLSGVMLQGPEMFLQLSLTASVTIYKLDYTFINSGFNFKNTAEVVGFVMGEVWVFTGSVAQVFVCSWVLTVLHLNRSYWNNSGWSEQLNSV